MRLVHGKPTWVHYLELVHCPWRLGDAPCPQVSAGTAAHSLGRLAFSPVDTIRGWRHPNDVALLFETMLVFYVFIGQG